jgi:hypothetical protein
MVMDVDYSGEAEMSNAVMANQVRKKKGTKSKTKRKGKKKDCGCPK